MNKIGLKGRVMTRRELREHTFKLIFGVEFYPSEEADEQIENYLEDQIPDGEKDGEPVSKDEAREEVRTHAKAVLERIPEIDRKIENVLEGWTIGRIGKAELNLLRVAVFEILHDDTIDAPVAIDEAVELAKKYGGDDSPKFINGVLAKIIK